MKWDLKRLKVKAGDSISTSMFWDYPAITLLL